MAQLQKNYDLFLLSAGYEDRALSALETIKGRVKTKKILINFFQVDDEILLESNRKNLENMINISNELGDSSPLVIKSDPGFEKKWCDTVEKYLLDVKTVLIDITSFTRLFLYGTLHILQKKDLNIQVLYSDPEDYTHNLSHGLSEIKILPYFSGVPDQSKKILMIMILGWESRRAESVIEEFEPDLLITIGERSNDLKRDFWNRVTFDACKKIRKNSEYHLIRGLRPDMTFIKFEEIYKEYCSEYDFCIVNIGPKIHCLAIAEFAMKHPEVQVLYAKPRSWMKDQTQKNPSSLSYGKGRTYIFPFNPKP